MRTIYLTSLASVALLSACTSPNGYYDANGRFISTVNNTPRKEQVHTYNAAEPTAVVHQHPATYDSNGILTRTTTVTYTYDRPGYYDASGNYYTVVETGPQVPADMFPPRGLCRVWFTNRPIESQPAVEACDGISGRVPAGAYVIYGG